MKYIMKVSGVDWLCISLRGQWTPVFKLTAEQVRAFKAFEEEARLRHQPNNLTYIPVGD